MIEKIREMKIGQKIQAVYSSYIVNNINLFTHLKNLLRNPHLPWAGRDVHKYRSTTKQLKVIAL
jgi:hypothetical protein